jgi:hypothetical protein
MKSAAERLAWWLVVATLILRGAALAAGQHAESAPADAHGVPAEAPAPVSSDTHETGDAPAATAPGRSTPAAAAQPSLEAVVDRIYRRMSAETARSQEGGNASDRSASSTPPQPATTSRAAGPAQPGRRVVLTWRTVLVWPEDLLGAGPAAVPGEEPPVQLDWR